MADRTALHALDDQRSRERDATAHFVRARDVRMGWIFFYMLSFGAFVGLTFPWVVAGMVDWKPGQELWFRLACVGSGLVVGGFAYGVARFTLYRANQHLAHLAMYDPLTGLANQRHFYQQLRAEISRASRQQGVTGLIIGDLDRFKQVNDSVGHLVGNEVLAAVGRVIAESVRTYDICCRVGGEEFAVILPDTDEDGAFIVAERIRTAVATMTEETLPSMTISLGIAVSPHDAATLKDLVRHADDAMYAAKDAGRNITCTSRVARFSLV